LLDLSSNYGRLFVMTPLSIPLIRCLFETVPYHSNWNYLIFFFIIKLIKYFICIFILEFKCYLYSIYRNCKTVVQICIQIHTASRQTPSCHVRHRSTPINRISHTTNISNWLNICIKLHRNLHMKWIGVKFSFCLMSRQTPFILLHKMNPDELKFFLK
jgi:hypothetical protein